MTPETCIRKTLPNRQKIMLEALAAKRNPEKASFRSWLDLKPNPKWDPNEFNYLVTHKKLRLVVDIFYANDSSCDMRLSVW